MESRGIHPVDEARSRPPISRRSCDYCRARKIACDRGSSCSNCISARLSCSYSKVAPTKATPKQRILLSSQYERKIDDIAKGIEEVKSLLDKHQNTPQPSKETKSFPETHSFKHNSAVPPQELQRTQLLSAQDGQHSGDPSTYIINFVNCVIRFPDPGDLSFNSSTTLSSLKSLIQSLESPSDARKLDTTALGAPSAKSDVPGMPPLEAAISVLRWIKDHRDDPQVVWISQILPLEILTDTCKKVYFAIDEYSEVEFILANGSLSYIFAAHATGTGTPDYQPHSKVCRDNVRGALRRLPLLLPTSIEAVAALIFGTLNEIESSDAAIAWTLVSNAADLCQRMGFEDCSRLQESQKSPQSLEGRLFATVCRLEKALSLRLRRRSAFHAPIGQVNAGSQIQRLSRLFLLLEDACDALGKMGRLSTSLDGQDKAVDNVVEELREAVRQTQRDVVDYDLSMGPVEVICLQSELASQSSLLFIILDMASSGGEIPAAASEELAAISRDLLDISQHWMKNLCSWTTDPLLISNYVDWCTWHTSFAAFSALFSRAVSCFDFDDLDCLESFVASVKMMERVAVEADCHPYRVYNLLTEAARLHIEGKLASSFDVETMMRSYAGGSEEFDFASLDFDMDDPAFNQ